MGRSKYFSNCSECNKKTKGNYIGRNGFVCYNCSRSPNDIKMPLSGSPRVSFKEALERIYEIKGYKQNKHKTFHANCSFPSILIGHKFKIQLIK